jgi:hypothetical protein
MFETDRVFQVKTLNVCDNIGYYSIIKEDRESIYWDNCREIFAKSFTEDSFGFYYVVDYKKVEDIMSFINQAEKILGINSFTKFFKTNKENIIAVIPSKFWMDCFLKRSLLTLLFRVAFFHKKHYSFEDTLFKEFDETIDSKIDSNKKDVIKTKNAIIRFFLGNTKYCGVKKTHPELGPWKHGWVEEFAEKSDSDIRKLLICENYSISNFLFF